MQHYDDDDADADDRHNVYFTYTNIPNNNIVSHLVFLYGISERCFCN